MSSLNDFIDPDLKTSDVVHSIGYVAVGGSSSIGGASASGVPLDKRRQLSSQPRVVGSYQFSELGRRRQGVKARSVDQKSGRIYDASTETLNDSARFSNRRPGGTGPERPSQNVEHRQHFVEPPARNHNPFA